MAVGAVGQIGCIPYQLARYDGGGANGSRCNERINRAVAIYNTGLQAMVNRFNVELPNAKFTFINNYGSFKDLLSNAASYGDPPSPSPLPSSSSSAAVAPPPHHYSSDF